MEFDGTTHVIEIGALLVPWNSMELLVSAKLAHSKFHGIPWNCSCQQNWRILSSMEFHGTACVSEIGALLVPWNSMELFMSLKLAYSKFLGIPWNCSCQRNWRTPSSMEFHGTSRVSEIGVLQVPWNSMELFVSAKLAHSKFHTARVIEIGAPKVPWNSMEFHGTALVIEIGTLLVPWNSMEFHGTSRVSDIGALQVPWNSMEFLGTDRVSEIGTLQVPWNSMELLVSAKLAHSKFH